MAALPSPCGPTVRLAVVDETTGDRIALYGRLRGVQESYGGGLDDDREGGRRRYHTSLTTSRLPHVADGIEVAKNVWQLPATVGHIVRRRCHAFTPTVGALAARTHPLAGSFALKRPAALQALARLGDVGAFRCWLRVARHPRRLPRIVTVANRDKTHHRVPDGCLWWA